MQHIAQDIRQADITDWKNTVAQLQSDVRGCTAEIEAMNTPLIEPRNRLAELNELLAPLILERELLIAPLAVRNAQRAIEEVTAEKKLLLEQIETLLKPAKEIKKKIEDAAAKVKLFERAETLKQLEGEHNRIKDRIITLTKSIQLISSETIATKQEQNKAIMDRALAQQELTAAQEKAEILNKQIAEQKKDFTEYGVLKFHPGGLADLINEARKTLAALKDQEKEIEIENKPIVANLRQQVNEKTIVINEQSHLKSKSEKLIEAASKNVSIEKPDLALADIVNKIRNLEAERADIEQIIKPAQDEIRSLTARLDELKRELIRLNQKMFIAQYVYQPEQMLQDIYQRLNEHLEQYKIANRPLSNNALLCIAEYEHKANFIVNGERRAEESEDSKQFYQLRIQQLYGFIYAHQQKYSASCSSLCNEFSIVLGDEKLDEAEAKNKYFELQLDHDAILDQVPELEEVTTRNYDDAVTAFKDSLDEVDLANAPDPLKLLVLSGRHLLETIQLEAPKHNSLNDYTAILESANLMLKNYNNKDQFIVHQNALANCAKSNIDGKRNIPNTIKGALAVFLGVAGIVACILTAGLTGSTSLLGLALAAPCILFGLDMIINAKPTGTAKALADYQSAASKAARKSNLLSFKVPRISGSESLPLMYEYAARCK